jgi:hypothetical protein
MDFGEEWAQPMWRSFLENGFWILDWEDLGEESWKMMCREGLGVGREGSWVERDQGACLGFEGDGVLNICFLL